VRQALEKDYDNLLPTMEKIGFIQKGAQVSNAELDDMMRQHVDPLQVDVFHYTRAWLQEVAARSIGLSVDQIKAARQMDIPAKLAIPMRVISSTVAIACQLGRVSRMGRR
jgi:predicted unusual protein kinase regulating ubiquinone biosynthesis (AarF/ABC1/UbiB family)